MRVLRARLTGVLPSRSFLAAAGAAATVALAGCGDVKQLEKEKLTAGRNLQAAAAEVFRVVGEERVTPKLAACYTEAVSGLERKGKAMGIADLLECTRHNGITLNQKSEDAIDGFADAIRNQADAERRLSRAKQGQAGRKLASVLAPLAALAAAIYAAIKLSRRSKSKPHPLPPQTDLLAGIFKGIIQNPARAKEAEGMLRSGRIAGERRMVASSQGIGILQEGGFAPLYLGLGSGERQGVVKALVDLLDVLVRRDGGSFDADSLEARHMTTLVNTLGLLALNGNLYGMGEAHADRANEEQGKRFSALLQQIVHYSRRCSNAYLGFVVSCIHLAWGLTVARQLPTGIGKEVLEHMYTDPVLEQVAGHGIEALLQDWMQQEETLPHAFRVAFNSQFITENTLMAVAQAALQKGGYEKKLAGVLSIERMKVPVIQVLLQSAEGRAIISDAMNQAGVDVQTFIDAMVRAGQGNPRALVELARKWMADPDQIEEGLTLVARFSDGMLVQSGPEPITDPVNGKQTAKAVLTPLGKELCTAAEAHLRNEDENVRGMAQAFLDRVKSIEDKVVASYRAAAATSEAAAE